jgi:hypothetical protein
MEDAVSLVVDIHCRPCQRPDRLGPRLARFGRDTAGGVELLGQRRLVTSGPQWHVYDNRMTAPDCRTRRDGGRTWYLKCRCGHEPRVPEEQVSAALDTITPDAAGNGVRRVSL